MSWEAVTWATKQRMKSSHEQLVLLVLANAADPDGVAFARWPGRDHWWKYLVDLTRLSKSTLFRDINTLIDVGLCARSMIVMSDGTRRPTIQLDLAANFKFDKEQNAHSHTETEGDEEFEDSDNPHDVNTLQTQNDGTEIHSHTETGPTSGNEPDTAIPTGGNDPFPVAGMHKDTSSVFPKDSPLPPSGGPCVRDDLFEEFVKAWFEPIPKMALARSAWDHVATDKRSEGIAAAKGYRAWLRAHPKPPAEASAQSFIRDVPGWAQWLRYVPGEGGNSVSINTSHPVDSPAGKAIIAVYEIAAANHALRSFMIRNGAVNYLAPITPRLLAMALAAPIDSWPVLTRQQASAWESFLRETVTVQVRKHLREGDRAPWPWPPRKDGGLSPTGPPESDLTEAEMADFK